VIPQPDEAFDFPLTLLQGHLNLLAWISRPTTRRWLRDARLDWFGTFSPPAPEEAVAAEAHHREIRAQIMKLCVKLRALLDTMPEKDAARAKAQLAEFGSKL
jgi:hypothetical protein